MGNSQEMKVTPELIRYLNNFAAINMNIKIEEGNKIKTRTVAKSLVSYATLTDPFPVSFCIYDLSSFLGVINMFDTPWLVFDDDEYVIVTDEDRRASFKYYFADENVIVYPEKDIQMPTTDIEFQLNQKALKDITKAASMLKLENICVRGRKESNITVIVTDKETDKSNQFSIEVDQIAEEDFDMWYNIKNWVFLPDDYLVQISSKKISRFCAENEAVEYYVALDKKSTYGSTSDSASDSVTDENGE